MNLKEFNKKIGEWSTKGWITKLIMLIAVAGVAFYPFFSAQSKMKKALGDQPKMITGIYISIIIMIFIILFAIIKTRPKNPND